MDGIYYDTEFQPKCSRSSSRSMNETSPLLSRPTSISSRRSYGSSSPSLGKRRRLRPSLSQSRSNSLKSIPTISTVGGEDMGHRRRGSIWRDTATLYEAWAPSSILPSSDPKRVPGSLDPVRNETLCRSLRRYSTSISPRPNKRRERLGVWIRPTLILENSGSVARDHLASERTFLAYVRTSLAIASAGVALVQLFTVSVRASFAGTEPPSTGARRIAAMAKPLGATTVLLGVGVLLLGFTRYFAVQSALTKGYFPATRVAVGAISMALVSLVVITFAILLSGKLSMGSS